MRGNTITLRMAYGYVAQAGDLWQYDYGQRLIISGVELPPAYEVHFANAENGTSKTVIGDDTGADIPDEFLLTGDRIHVWIYLHNGEDDGETVYHGIINVVKRAKPTDAEPTPVQQSEIDQAIAALNAGISTVEEIAEGIPQTIDTALEAAKESGEFDGDPGQDGFSPIITVTDITGGHRVTITDATGSRSVDVMDGEPGTPGNPGADGVSPTVAVSPITDGHRVTITDKTGPHSFDVMDGEKGDPGEPTELIDDTAGAGDTDKVWSADKTAGEVSDLSSAINQKQDTPSTAGTAGQVLGLDSNLDPVWQTPASAPVQDVQVNGVSVLNQGVANVPVAASGTLGVVRADNYYGVDVIPSGSDSNLLRIRRAESSHIKAGTNAYKPIVPVNQNESIFYGLAKLAGADMASVTGETVGVYPEAQKVAIQKMLGIYQAPWELIRADTGTNATETDVDITVDGNGNAFELTDFRIVFWTPTQETEAKVADFGKITAHRKGESSSSVDTLYIGAYTQAESATSRVSAGQILQSDGMIQRESWKNGTNNSEKSSISIIRDTETGTTLWQFATKSYDSIKIGKVTGTWGYRLYGKRKWN